MQEELEPHHIQLSQYTTFLKVKQFLDTKEETNLIENDQVFEFELDHVLFDLPKNERDIIIKYLKQKYSCLQLWKQQKYEESIPGFFQKWFFSSQVFDERQLNLTRTYYIQKISKDSQNFFNSAQSDEFLEQNHIPSYFKEYIPLLSKLKNNEDVFKILNILDYCIEIKFSMNFTVVKDLCYFLFYKGDDLSEVEIHKLHQLVAIITSKLIFQFEHLHSIIDESEEMRNQYNTMVNQVQLAQLQINQQTPQVLFGFLSNDQPNNLVTIAKVALLGLHNYHNIYLQFLKQIIQCEKEVTYDDLLYLEDDEWEIGYEKIEQLYFLTLFYFWIKSNYLDLLQIETFVQDAFKTNNTQYTFDFENKVKKIIKNETQYLIKGMNNDDQKQMLPYLAKTILLYMKTDRLAQVPEKFKQLKEQEKIDVQRLQHLNLIQPINIFRFEKLLIIYRIINTVSHQYFQNNLKMFLILIQQLSRWDFKFTTKLLVENINPNLEMNICNCVQFVKQYGNQINHNNQRLLLKLFSIFYKCQESYKFYKQFLNQQIELSQLQQLLKFQEIMQMWTHNNLKELQNFSFDDWSFIKMHELLKVEKLIDILVEHIIQAKQFKEATHILKMISVKSIEGYKQAIGYIFEIFQIYEYPEIEEIFGQNQKDCLDLNLYLKTVRFLMYLYSQFNSEYYLLSIFEMNFNLIFCYFANYYDYQFIKRQIKANCNIQDLEQSLILIFHNKNSYRHQLLECAYKFYRNKPDTYARLMGEFDYFNDPVLQPFEMRLRLSVLKYPEGIGISLEEFNISLSFNPETIHDEQKKLIDLWLMDIKSQDAFKALIPLFFNSIKRGESLEKLVQQVNGSIELMTKMQSIEYFNKKALFQLFYNNSNSELKVMLLKIYCKLNPVPLVYRSSNIENPFVINSDIFFIFQDCIPLINFSFSKGFQFFGKTELINKIFYRDEKFQIRDTCEINYQTVDIMFDYSFNGTRKLCIADAHGSLPFEILNKILPLFTVWIIQLKSELEIAGTLESLLNIPENIRRNKQICFIIRNSKSQQLPQEQNDQLKKEGILYLLMKDVSTDALSQELIQREINLASRFLYGIIQKQELVTQQQFQNIIIDQCEERQDFQEKSKLITSLVEHLEIIVKQEEGFFSPNAFPIRNIGSKIKFKKNEIHQLNLKQHDENTENQKNILLGEIKNLENIITLQSSTSLLDLFSKIFEQKNYYVVYLWFVDKIRQFNEIHNNFLYQENQKINDEIAKLKQDIQRVGNNLQDIQLIIQTIQQLKQELIKNQEKILLRNIGIEMFWRELIQQQQLCKDQMQTICPSEIVFQMIAKGEPFEFLNGDSLQIDYNFLQQMVSNFKEKGKERVLVFSVLGPQSSGKSTILNKIFGCHFWTSVGRCTKGIYLQVLKVQNQEINKNLFDYIILLDTEGLQSPTQQDQEFDKKIALFILTISDIILINVKGDMNAQFKNLVEMCIFTLGQLKNLSQFKQLSWCFNQNNDTSNYPPFIQQLEGITQNLHRSDFQEQNIDYAEILGATQNNIKILGFSQNEEIWQKNQLTGVFTDWKQQKINHTYSEEAYSYGVSIIQRFMKKNPQEQNEEFYSLQYCFEKMNVDWQRIERLPDLLEFSELIQHQQNLLMKAEFEIIIRNENQASCQEIIQTIPDQIFQRGQLVLDDFSQIKQTKYQEIQMVCDLIQQQMTDQLLAVKNHHKISKKIFIKYEKMIKERIGSQKSELQLSVQNEIKNYETDFQKKKGFLKLDQFVHILNQNQQRLKEYQNNENLIHLEFEKIWEKIMADHVQSQEDMFRECSNKLFDVICQEFSQYSLRSENQNEYKQMMRQFFSIQPSNDDFDKIFDLFQKELRQNQLIFLEKSQKNYQFQEIFFRDLDLKLQTKTNQDILPIDYFYQYQIVIYYVKQIELQEYLKQDILLDVHALYQSRRNFKSIISDLKTFFNEINMIGAQFNQQEVDNLISDIVSNYPMAQCRTVSFSLNTKVFFSFDNRLLFTNIHQSCKRLKIHQQQILSNEKFCEKNRKNLQPEIILYVQSTTVIKMDHIPLAQDQQVFEYVQNPQAFSHHQGVFRGKICSILNHLMFEKQIWKKKVYLLLFNLIHQESQNDLNSIFETGISKNYKNSQYNVSLIKIILGKIQEQIKLFNKQFANYGVMLDVVGERCMSYFAMLIIWRIQCYGQYNFVQNNIQKLNNLKDEQYSKFKADINQNKVKQSQIRGAALASEIFNLRHEKLYLDYENRALQYIQAQFSNLQDSYQLVQHLDQKILQRNNENISATDDEILRYLRNHKQYIEEEVNERIMKVKQLLLEDFEPRIRLDMRKHLEQVKANSKNLKECTHDLIQAEEYFQDKSNKNQNYPNILYKMVQSCLQGSLDQTYFAMIKKELQDAFITLDFQVLSAPIISNVQNQSDQEIQILKFFIIAFDEKIKEFIQNTYTMPLLLDKLNIQTLLDEIKFKLVGCLETCPICRRKCDEDPKDKEHRHQCRNGHQLRGITGVLIGDSPSLFTCEEILDDYVIELQEDQVTKSWGQIKQIYSNWQFSYLDKDELERHKKKIINIWNDNIGEMICRLLTQELGQSVKFIKKMKDTICNTGIQHYILMLDSSGSMAGSKWQTICDCAIKFTIELQQKAMTRISLILFNHEAKCVIDNKIPNALELRNALTFEGGGTDFDKAFLKVCNCISLSQQQTQDISQFVILFYTDGDACYPKEAVNLFSAMPQHIRNKIELIACSEEDNHAILHQTINNLKPILSQVKFRQSVSSYQVHQVWTETIYQKFHKLQC